MISIYVKNLVRYIDENDKISTCDLIEVIGIHSSFLFVLLILSIMNIVFAPLPINSFVLGIPLIFFSCCYLFGTKNINFSSKILRKSINCVSWRRYMQKVLYYFDKISRISRPRFGILCRAHKRIFSGIILATISLLIFLPIPFINSSGSVAMILILLGILQKDGLFLMAGYFLFLMHVLFLMVLVFKFLEW